MMKVLLPIAWALMLFGCGLPPRVESAAPTEASPMSFPLVWPRALDPPEPVIEVQGAQAPVDQGRYGKCDVMLIDRSEKGTVLFHIGRLAEASPLIGATATFAHPAPDRTRVTLTVDNGAFSVMSLIYPAYPPRVKGHVFYVGTMALLSTPEQRFIEHLREEGWHVAALVPFSVMSEFKQLAADPALRHSSAEEAAPKVASLIDHHLASQVYATESLLKYLQSQEPEFLVGKRMLIGGSMGSLAIPATAARIGQVDGMVLLASGGNVSRIIHESKLGMFVPGEKIIVEEKENALLLAERHPGELQHLKERVFEETRLDPLRAAPSLTGIRTLMLTARRDRIIPVAQADLLHQALGRPERWIYPLGHVALFVRLPQQAGRIEAWMAR